MSESLSKDIEARNRLSYRRGLMLMLAVYLIALLTTDAYFMADTMDYVNNVIDIGMGARSPFWEVGHLLWRPMGLVLYRNFGAMAAHIVGGDAHKQMALLFVIVNYLAGFVSVATMYDIAVCVSRRASVGVVTTLFFVFSHAFLNFSQTGTSYAAGLMFLLFGIDMLIRGSKRINETTDSLSSPFTFRYAALAGIALACAVCLWLPYLFALPAALLSPFISPSRGIGEWRRDARLMWQTVLCGTACGMLIFGAVFVQMGIYNFVDFKAWILSSPSVGTTLTSGFSRAVFGLARSFINMSNDGMLFKRYLVHDPFNSVTLSDLLRFSLWKFALFYAALFASAFILWRTQNKRRVLLLTLVNVAPVFCFAVAFDGGAIERYLPLYPLIFIALASVFGDNLSWRNIRDLRFIVFAACVVMVGVNLRAMAKPTLNREQEKNARRIAELAARLPPHSQITTVTWMDELINFNRSFPFNPANRYDDRIITSLVTPGTASLPQWRENFAVRVLDLWSRNGEVWLSKEAFAERPRAAWNWVEGDDKRISWTDFPAFASQLETGDAVGGDEGFVLIARSAKNEQFFRRILHRN